MGSSVCPAAMAGGQPQPLEQRCHCHEESPECEPNVLGHVGGLLGPVCTCERQGSAGMGQTRAGSLRSSAQPEVGLLAMSLWWELTPVW